MQKIIIGREYPDVIIDLVKQSKHSIKILIYDWRWYQNEVGSRIQTFNNEILQAVNRGVDITVLANNNFVASILKDSRIKIKKVNTQKVMHVKMVIFDNQYLLLGSHNLTKNAFELNHEMSVLLDDKNSISKCNLFFDNLCHL